MIQLTDNRLIVRFPEVHEDAVLSLDFQRTLRIPDDDNDYPLPAGLGSFPLQHVDDFAAQVPASWIEHGGVMLPMYQSEAMWIHFHGRYPFAVKIGAGKINAVTGKSLKDGINRRPQDYLVVPDQPWLDGYCVEKGIIRQFVAMPLGTGYSAEEQITGEGAYGGLQLVVYPMKAEAYRRLVKERVVTSFEFMDTGAALMAAGAPDMGLAAGGRMRQEIFEDHYGLDDWDLEHKSRCFVHIANSMVWRAITGSAPPTVPPTAKEYARAGIPCFEYYDDGQKALKGSGVLEKLKSVAKLGKKKGDVPLPDNEAAPIDTVIELRKGLEKGQVREGVF